MDTPESYIKEQLEKFDRVIPFDDFSDVVTSAAHIFEIPKEEAQALFHKLRGEKEVGSQEASTHGSGKNNLWQGQSEAHGFGMRPPGDLAEPKSMLKPVAAADLLKQQWKVGDEVRVVKNDQAPWGAEYNGVIITVNPDNTFDILDEKTESIQLAQPQRLLKNRIGVGREDKRIQQRRVGDPKGLGESAGDVGGSEVKQDYPNTTWEPSGHPGQEVKNPQSMFYKEAKDVLYIALISKIEQEYGKNSAEEVTRYVKGEILSPSGSLRTILCRYNIVARDSNAFWDEKVTWAKEPELKHVVVRINGNHYVIGNEDAKGPFRGFGGRPVGIRFRDGTEVISTNLWSQGTIPEEYRKLLPDNADFFNVPPVKKDIAPQAAEWEEHGLKFKIGKYANGDMAVSLYTRDDEPYAKVSVSLEEKPAPGCFWLNDVSMENVDLAHYLLQKGYVEATGRRSSNDYKEVKLADSALGLQKKAETMLNVEKALGEVKGKTVEQINAETAWTWGSRAAACYKLSSEASSEEEKDKWYRLGDDYRHESLEHAALVEDEGKLVGEVSRALAPFRK